MEQISVETGPKVIDSFWLTKTEHHAPSAEKALKQMAFAFPTFQESQQCNVRDPRCKHKRSARMRRKRETANDKRNS
jgi:hypothetical protein